MARDQRQVKICGVAEKISVEESWEYFSSRPKGSQIAAAASPQSRVIDSRAELMREYERIEQQYQDDNLPLPDNWGGYRVVPNEFEFWQGGAHHCMTVSGTPDRAVAGWWTDWRPNSDWLIQAFSPPATSSVLLLQHPFESGVPGQAVPVWRIVLARDQRAK